MTLSEEKVKAIIKTGTPECLYAHKRVLVLTLDGTRTCPLPMICILSEVIGVKAARRVESIASAFPASCRWVSEQKKVLFK
jgi:hypothetical protein